VPAGGTATLIENTALQATSSQRRPQKGFAWLISLASSTMISGCSDGEAAGALHLRALLFIFGAACETCQCSQAIATVSLPAVARLAHFVTSLTKHSSVRRCCIIVRTLGGIQTAILLAPRACA
jgi:hypothetical protein